MNVKWQILGKKLQYNLNPIPIGLFRGLESIGGGGGLIWPPPPPPQISATNGPIDSKIGSRKTSQVELKKWRKKKFGPLLFFYN